MKVARMSLLWWGWCWEDYSMEFLPIKGLRDFILEKKKSAQMSIFFKFTSESMFWTKFGGLVMLTKYI